MSATQTEAALQVEGVNTGVLHVGKTQVPSYCEMMGRWVLFMRTQDWDLQGGKLSRVLLEIEEREGLREGLGWSRTCLFSCLGETCDGLYSRSNTSGCFV